MGQGGNDQVFDGAGSDTVRSPGNAGADVVKTGEGADVGFFDRDVAHLGPGADFALALGGSSVFGGEGADYLVPFGATSFDGGPGADTLSLQRVDFSAEGVTADLAEGSVDVGAAVRFTAVEGFDGSEGDDVLYGDAGANTIMGGPGDDQIFGLGGNDMLTGGEDDDAVDGGDGADSCSGETRVDGEQPSGGSRLRVVVRRAGGSARRGRCADLGFGL